MASMSFNFHCCYIRMLLNENTINVDKEREEKPLGIIKMAVIASFPLYQMLLYQSSTVVTVLGTAWIPPSDCKTDSAAVFLK